MAAIGREEKVPFPQLKAQALLKGLAHGRKESAAHEWQTWAEEALKRGAGKAHRWTNAPNVAVPSLQTTRQGDFHPEALAEAARNTWCEN